MPDTTNYYEARRRPTPITEAACWSHGRRKFFDLAKLTKAPIACEAVRRIDQLTAIVVQTSAVPESVAFFAVDGGFITGPLTFPIQATEHIKSQSMESRVQSTLATLPPPESKTALETMEHLALLKRWFYRSTRSGEIFFADIKGGLPLRRLVRGIARVYRGEKPEPTAANLEDRVTGP